MIAFFTLFILIIVIIFYVTRKVNFFTRALLLFFLLLSGIVFMNYVYKSFHKIPEGAKTVTRDEIDKW